MAESNTLDGSICTKFLEFRNFLSNLSKNADANNSEFSIRRDNDSYPVSTNEVHAEVIMVAWSYLQNKRCPEHYRFSLIRAVKDAVDERRVSKECEFLYVPRKLVLEETVLKTDVTVQYDSSKLEKFVVNNLEMVLIRLIDNIELENLEDYADPGTHCKGECRHRIMRILTDFDNDVVPPYYIAGYTKNKPRKMEDRHSCIERFCDMYEINKPQKNAKMSFFSVFDGHSGPCAANYAARQLPFLLSENLRYADQNEPAFRAAFESAFLQTDHMFTQKQIASGTTAVCALLHQSITGIEPTHLYVAWVGDSKALLVGKTSNLQLVKTHKPDGLEERRRIEASGGSVLYIQGQWRVNGILSVSRSIGDYNVSPVIAEPDFIDVEITQAHDMIVLGTDGLWDHAAEVDIVKTIYTALLEDDSTNKVEDIPKLLIDLAKQGDSQDNITVVIVFLKKLKEITENYRKN